MEKFHAERLLVLADALENLVPAEHFNFQFIFRGKTATLFEQFRQKGDATCQSAGCAIGWCPVIFPKLFEYRERRNGEIGLIGRIFDEPFQSFPAIREAFGLTSPEARKLFEIFSYSGPSRLVTKERVAVRIRELVTSKGF